MMPALVLRHQNDSHVVDAPSREGVFGQRSALTIVDEVDGH